MQIRTKQYFTTIPNCWLVGLLIPFILSSCSINSMYENTADIPNAKWNKENILRFSVPVNDSINNYKINFSIRNNNNYPYSNICLFVDTRSPNGLSIRDTIEMELCDNQGKWNGKGIGGLWQNTVYYQKRFSTSGNYVISFSQAMRDDILEGIVDIGIKIEKFSK